MKHTNKYNLPKHIEEAIVKNTYDLAQDDPSIISMTTLINPPRMRQLIQRHWAEVEEDISGCLWKLLGSSVHEVMQRISSTNRLIEERLKEPIMGITVAGRPDIYEEPDLNDYKVTSVWAVKYEKVEWEQQLNGYAWFLRKLGFEVRKAYINALLRDWRRGEFKRAKDKDYPPIPFKIIEVPLWSFEEQDDFVHQRISVHLNAVTEPDDKLPMCTEKERWTDDRRCKDYCLAAPFCTHWQKCYNDDKPRATFKFNG